MAVRLTRGTVQALVDDDKANPLYANPVLQVMVIKKMPGQATQGKEGPERHRMVLSDGGAFFQAMLATSLNHLVSNETIRSLSILRITRFTISLVKERRVMIVHEVDQQSIVYANERIGAPVNIEEQAKPPSPQAASRAELSAVDPGITQISSLNPYKNAWTIRARVTFKSEVKTWKKEKSQGKLFSANLMDSSGEIRMTGFNDEVDRFYSILEVDKVYTISRAQVKLSKKQFSSLANDYEIHLERDTEIVPFGGAASVPAIRYKLVKIGDIGGLGKNESADVMGVVQEIGAVSRVMVKATQKEQAKRDVVLVDPTLHSIRLTLWGGYAEDPDRDKGWRAGAVVLVRDARVTEFNGKSLSTLSSTVVMLNPETREAQEMLDWYESVGRHGRFASVSTGGPREQGARSRKTVAQLVSLVNEEDEGFFDLVAVVSFIKSDGTIAYASCPGVQEGGGACAKKVVEMDPGVYRCERCMKSVGAPVYRYVLTLGIADMTGQCFGSAFNEVAATLLGYEAKELLDLRDSDPDRYIEAFKHATNTILAMRVRVRNEMYAGEPRQRISVSSARPIDAASESKLLLDQLRV